MTCKKLNISPDRSINQNMKKTLLKFTVTALMGSTILAPTMPALAAENVIATVGSEEITQDDFYQAMKTTAGKLALRTMIIEKVLMQAVKDPEAHRKAAQEEVAKQMEEAGGEDVFQQLLAYQQLGTVEDYTYSLFVQKMLEEVVGENTDMSDEAIKSYYEEKYQPTMEAQHILVETEDEAKAAIERINNGEEFDAVAKEVSKDSTAQNGGLLSPFKSGQMVKEFEDAVKAQGNGEVTQEPVKSQYGYHVIKTIDNGEKKPLDEVREEVEQDYVQSQFTDSQTTARILGQLIKDAGVEVKDKALEDAVSDLIQLTEQPVEEAKEEKSEATSEAGEQDAQAEAESESSESSN